MQVTCLSPIVQLLSRVFVGSRISNVPRGRVRTCSGFEPLLWPRIVSQGRAGLASRPTDGVCAEAVRVALTSGRLRKRVAAEFGIGFSTLSRWIQQDRRDPETLTTQSDLQRETSGLRKGEPHAPGAEGCAEKGHGVPRAETQMRFAVVAEHRNEVSETRYP